MKRLPLLFFVSGLTGLLSLGGLWATVAQADSDRNFTLDVSMDGRLGGVNTTDGGAFQRALVGVFNGNIYPKRTLRRRDETFDPASDGEIGTWRCLFTALNDVAFPSGTEKSLDFPLTGAVTYHFQLHPTGYDRSESTLVVMGLNSHTFHDKDNVTRVLAVVGGTGRYAGATGEVRETVLGRNMTTARNLRFRFRLNKVGDDRHHH